MTGMGIDDYQFDRSGRITSPGKFEGGMVYLPHFYKVSLDGTADIAGSRVRIDVDASDRETLRGYFDRERDAVRRMGLEAALSRLKGKRSVSFIERDDGIAQEV